MSCLAGALSPNHVTQVPGVRVMLSRYRYRYFSIRVFAVLTGSGLHFCLIFKHASVSASDLLECHSPGSKFRTLKDAFVSASDLLKCRSRGSKFRTLKHVFVSASDSVPDS
jgi:hypothetical protein